MKAKKVLMIGEIYFIHIMVIAFIASAYLVVNKALSIYFIQMGKYWRGLAVCRMKKLTPLIYW